MMGRGLHSVNRANPKGVFRHDTQQISNCINLVCKCSTALSDFIK